MLVASKLVVGGAALAPAVLRRAGRVELDWDTRQKSRFDVTDSLGRHVGVFLPRGQAVRGGDVLVVDDGSLLVVAAKAQPVLRVRVGDHGKPLDLLRAAYHLGNRHVPLEVRPDHLQLEPDHVLAELMGRMGLRVDTVEAAFEPEGGAYGAAHAHGRGHDHVHEREHEHEHEHDRDDDHAHDHPHPHP